MLLGRKKRGKLPSTLRSLVRCLPACRSLCSAETDPGSSRSAGVGVITEGNEATSQGLPQLPWALSEVRKDLYAQTKKNPYSSSESITRRRPDYCGIAQREQTHGRDQGMAGPPSSLLHFAAVRSLRHRRSDGVPQKLSSRAIGNRRRSREMKSCGDPPDPGKKRPRPWLETRQDR